MPCGCGANKISSVLIEKLQKVRNIIGTSIIITSGVRCEFYNTSIKASMNSSHILDEHGIGNAVDIACTNSKDRYELVELSQKFFNRIGISWRFIRGVCSFGCRSVKGSRGDVALLKK